VLKSVWHWGSDSSVVNDPLGEQDRTPLCVGLLSKWGSVKGDLMLSPFRRRAPFSGTPVDVTINVQRLESIFGIFGLISWAQRIFRFNSGGHLGPW
jgi:hypothetical protein